MGEWRRKFPRLIASLYSLSPSSFRRLQQQRARLSAAADIMQTIPFSNLTKPCRLIALAHLLIVGWAAHAAIPLQVPCDPDLSQGYCATEPAKTDKPSTPHKAAKPAAATSPASVATTSKSPATSKRPAERPNDDGQDTTSVHKSSGNEDASGRVNELHDQPTVTPPPSPRP